METVFAFLAFAALVAVTVIVGAAVTALVLYAVILFFVWLWDKADEKVRKKGRHCQ